MDFADFKAHSYVPDTIVANVVDTSVSSNLFLKQYYFAKDFTIGST